MSARITALYVPGNRPDRFDKAVQSGAHIIILDLEDSVDFAEKSAARATVEAWALAEPPSTILQVRINALNSEWFSADLAMVARLSAVRPIELRVPKVGGPGDIDRVTSVVGHDVPIFALIETAHGLTNSSEIAKHPAVTALALGDSDLASDLGSSSELVLDFARITIVVASRGAGLIAPMMSVYPGIHDLDGLFTSTVRGQSLGLFGRTAVHPTQLAPIIRAFTPTDVQQAWAAEVLDVLGSGVGVARLSSGEMVDAAMIEKARLLLATVRDR